MLIAIGLSVNVSSSGIASRLSPAAFKVPRLHLALQLLMLLLPLFLLQARHS
jgi:hypothetical protein